MKTYEGNSQFKMIITLLVIVIVIAVINSKYPFLSKLGIDTPSNTNQQTVSNQVKLKLANGKELTLNIEIADTEEERQTGLMNKTFLDPQSGMLFVFQNETKTGFWMKNTLIPLDLLFVSRDKKIVDMKENFTPCGSDNCEIYTPTTQYLYVIEVNGGYALKESVKVGDSIEIISSGT